MALRDEYGWPIAPDPNQFGVEQAGKVQEKGLFMPPSELFSMEVPEPDWAIQGMLEQGSVMIVAGEPKTAKTWWTMEMALALGAGSKVGRHFIAPRQRPSAMWLLEDGIRSVQSRLRALAGRGNLNLSDGQLYNTWIHTKSRDPLSLTDYFQKVQLVDSLNALTDEYGIPGTLFIDPLRDAHRNDENSSAEMKEVTDNLREIRDITGWSVVVTHHTGKNKAGASVGAAMRGTSALFGMVDAYLEMRNANDLDKPSNQMLNDCYVRVKAGREHKPFRLELRLTDNEWGRAIDSKWLVQPIPKD